MVKVRVRVFKSIARSSRARQYARISLLYLNILLTELMIFAPKRRRRLSHSIMMGKEGTYAKCKKATRVVVNA